MQQESFTTESVRFASDGTQNQQYVVSTDGQASSTMLPNLQQNQPGVYNTGSSLTSQPPPYPSSQPLPSMTHAFSQQRQSQFSGNVVSPHVPYKGAQASYQGQSAYSAGVQGQTLAARQVVSPSSVPALSPGGQMPQGMQNLSPGAPPMPRKSLAGMMSPIKTPLQQSLNMPPPSSPVLNLRGPISPLSVYMSQAQSPRRAQVGHVQSLQGQRVYPNTASPAYHQQSVTYPYVPQQSAMPPSSPVASPRYMDTSQHGQMSPMMQTQGHLHSPPPVPPAGLPVQSQRSPFKAARQLSMAVSPTKVQPYSPAVVQQQWPYGSHTASQDMWESVQTTRVIPSLPVLSSDTLDLLSTLTVSTVTSPARSSTVQGVAGNRVPKSPLLQQHLLMPTQPIRTASAEGNLLAVSGVGMSASTSALSFTTQSSRPEAPPSRSGQKQSVRPPVIATEKNLINLSKPQISTASTVTTSTLSSSIVTSVSTDKTEDPKKMGDSVNTSSPVNRLAQASKAGGNEIAIRTSAANSAAVDPVAAPVVSRSIENSFVSLSESLSNSELGKSPQPPLVSPEVLEKRTKLCEIHRAKLHEKLEMYKECLTELFFLQNDGNFMDYSQFKKRPSTKLQDYLKKMVPETRHGSKKLRKISQDSISSNGEAMSPASDVSNSSSRKVLSEDVKKARHRSVSRDVASERARRYAPIEDKAVLKRSQAQDKPILTVTQAPFTTDDILQSSRVPTLKGQQSPLRLKRLSRPGPPASLDESIGSQEEILERAKQEAVIQRKVVELRKQGLWTQRRLPKVQDPPRNKTHWDYLLEEMRWLSADFAQERKWKRAAARKLVRAVAAYHKEQHDLARRAKREEHNRLRRIASTMAREIRIFWSNLGKVVEYKQRSLLDEKRQKALDLHLSYIVDQTEKYSDWLTQGLNKPQPYAASSPSTSLPGSKRGSDDEFLPQGESSDDEETIAVAEQELDKQENTEDELSLLKQESELPFEELLNSLPPELIENIGKPLEGPAKTTAESSAGQKEESAEPSTSIKDPGSSSEEEAEPSKPTPISLRRSARKRKTESTESSKSDEPEAAKKQKVGSEDDGQDDEFKAEEEEGSGVDDEATMEEEERKEEVDHDKEIADLQAEGEMPIEELMKMYGGAFDDDPEAADDTAEEESQGETEEVAEAEESSSEDEEGEEEKQEEEEIGMDYLFKADLTKDDAAPMIIPSDKPDSKEEKPDVEGSPSKEITDVAAEAASLQPTGFTLATTQVVTPIPILLKHTLREYQHIGLDWLVTMYDKRLNGILADEMGLGKTIQTIALLAHLACDKGVWGPHLIVVPTSVMLNWEMEFKKWCPGFKILTYYGSQKERKAKRTGWTKSNAFHVCITSYKLVLQDNASFRRKKWKYLVLDEAQNIKNFKSQRWQTLLNFNSQRRLLLTGTPLQNNLMELWSLMHFLMPHVFQSHKEFKEWFSNPLTGMIEGSQEYNEKLVRRLHKVLRPFLLRRIKKDVEKQMPNKYEHVVRCHLSKRQRFLYDDFMSQASTKDTLESGHFMSVINILMQLRKVCNHPNLFEPRPIVSPFMTDRIDFHAPSLITKVLDEEPFQTLNLQDYHLHLPSLTNIRQYNADRIRLLRTKKKLIEELSPDSEPREDARPIPPKMPSIKEHLANLLKDREKQKMKGITTLNLTPQSLQLLQHGQQTSTLPVLTLPITSGVQLSTSTGATRVITIPQSRSEDSSGRTVASSQSFTVQYQTPQGTRVAIPNKQVIRQIPGRVVQIMTSGAGSKAQAISQPVVSLSHLSQVSTARQNGEVAAETAKPDTPETVKPEIKKPEKLEVKDPPSYVERLEQEFLYEHKRKCYRMAHMNEKRCEANPQWLPGDTIDLLKNIYRRPEEPRTEDTSTIKSDTLLELVKSSRLVQKEMEPVTDRFVFVIPKVQAEMIDFHVSHPSPSRKACEETSIEVLEPALKKALTPLHSIDLRTRIQFPEARLIQYDCGKLQVLNVLLRRFWAEKHKCLIFTQMTKVLDILEAFLSYHGYRYLRLDGSTRVEQRMLLMERFNNDARIFCFILSTRSGGIGVNLTGADTVIFYDSDWNPTMDAQAQDRCHRIGQTRDVHIYRLISERTVEENILKKANQKRLLGDLAIEGGSFTTAFFKEQAIKDLFNEPSGLEELPTVEKDEKGDQPGQKQPAVLSKPVTARQKAIAAAKESEAKIAAGDQTDKKPKANSWEDALQQTEDKEDVDAAKQLREEQDADMEEFTENVEGDEGTEVSKVHEEMKSIYEELTPIEKYALKYLEETTEEINREELELAEEQVHRSKQDWEIAHLMALKEEEERRLEEEEDEIFYTREDAENQIYVDDVTGETMPVWFPPTPPQDESDIYIDPIARLLYLPGPMPEDQLPVIHVKKERKRTKTESDSPSGIPSQRRKMSRAEIHAPRSLFNRPQQLKRREPKYRPQQKKLSSVLPQAKAVTLPTLPTLASSADKENITASSDQPGLPSSSASSSTSLDPLLATPSSNKNLEWMINEDWKLLQAVQQVLEMPLSLAVLMPAHTPNWDLVADVVNSIGSVYRSPKMCKQRFENVIAPREEGRSATEIPRDLKKKIKGTKTPTKIKISKPQKTTNMHAVDNNGQYSTLYSNRFDAIKETCSKRTMPLKTSSSTQFQRNPKHTSILSENGITYDKPLPPVQVASLRADRIAREKAMEAAKQQQIVQTQTIQGHSSGVQPIGSSQTTKSGLSFSSVSQLTAIPISASASNIIVNPTALSAIKKNIQHSVSKTSLSSTALQQTLLRTAVSASEQSQQMQQHQQQIQIQQPGQGTMVTVGLLQRLSNTPGTMTTITTAVSSNNTIPLSALTRPSISVPTAGAQQIPKQLTKQQQQRLQMQLQLQKQQKKPVKAQPTPRKLQITPETMKRLAQRQQQQPEAGSLVTVNKVPGKRKPTQITQQEFEQLIKNQTIRRQMQKSQTAQVQIAPVHAQVQAQQVQEAAAQQAAQHVITSKPLPITVPVSNLVSVAAVNLGMNMSISSTNAGTSGQAKPLVMTGQQVPVNLQQQFQRQIMKQRMVTQQQQAQLQTQQQAAQTQSMLSKVGHSGHKPAVYAMVAAPPLGSGKRRVNVAASSTGQVVTAQPVQSGAQPVQLTVTKLLQSQSIPGQSGTQLKQPMTQQTAEAMAQQIRQQQQTVGQQQLQIASATIVPSSNVAQQQRLITSQRQIRQIQHMASNQQPTQMILTPASSQQFLQRTNQNVVASISIAASTAAAQQQMTLSAATQQNANLSQQLQSLLRAQPQAGMSAQAALRTSGQPHHLVLSQVNQQQTLAVSPQNPTIVMTSHSNPTTMTLAPSLVQLPTSIVSSSVETRSLPLISQPAMTDGSSGIQQQSASGGVHYVTRTMPQ